MASKYKGFIPLRPNKLKIKDNNCNHHGLNFNSKENKPIAYPPSPLTAPIIIRYIDPRLVPILVQLGKLSQMVETFAYRATHQENKQGQQELDGLIKSSKDLNAKMSAIMQENDVGFSSLGQPEQVNSQYQSPGVECGGIEFKSLKDMSVDQTDLESIDMIDVLNRVSSRMEELEEENTKLKVELQVKNSELQKIKQQKKTARTNISAETERDQPEIFSNIQKQIEKAIKNQQSVQQCLEKVQIYLNNYSKTNYPI